MKSATDHDMLDASFPVRQILIVESDWIMRKRLKALLMRRGYGVRAARSVRHVMAVFKHERPDLVIGNIRLSDATGVELVEHIRSFDAEVPIIWLDSHLGGETSRFPLPTLASLAASPSAVSLGAACDRTLRTDWKPPRRAGRHPLGDSESQTIGLTPDSIQAHLPMEVGSDRLLDEVERWLRTSRRPARVRWPGSILVVDDEPKIRQVLHAFLQLRGFMVTAAASGEEALQQLHRSTPRAILLDISMPGMGGLATLRQIRAHHPGLPIIMITALEDERCMDDALTIGAHDYLVKPFNLDHLEAMLLSRALLGDAAEP